MSPCCVPLVHHNSKGQLHKMTGVLRASGIIYWSPLRGHDLVPTVTVLCGVAIPATHLLGRVSKQSLSMDAAACLL